MSTRTICQIYTWEQKKNKQKRKQRNNSCIQLLLSERRNGTIDQQVYARDTIQIFYYFSLFVGPHPNTFKFSALLILHTDFFSFEEKSFSSTLDNGILLAVTFHQETLHTFLFLGDHYLNVLETDSIMI